MSISKKKKLALCLFWNYKCEDCLILGDDKKYLIEELEVHRIIAGYNGGTYDNHRNLKLICKKHHEIYSSAQRITMGIQK